MSTLSLGLIKTNQNKEEKHPQVLDFHAASGGKKITLAVFFWYFFTATLNVFKQRSLKTQRRCNGQYDRPKFKQNVESN